MTVMAFVTCFVIFGVVYSFGAFFKPMATEFGASRANTSIIFSVTAFIYNLLGIVGGHLTDRVGPRPVMIIGALALGLGLIATSFIGRLWIGYITYGLGIGIGVACTYVPMLAAVAGWFVRRRNTALGIAVSGIGCGTLAITPLAAALIQRFGWREADVIMGIASMLLLATCAMFAQAPPVPTSAGNSDLRQALCSRDFVRLYTSAMALSIAIYIPFVYLPEFAHIEGAGEVAAATLVGLIGASSIVGRLLLGAVADRTGIFSLYKASALVLGLSYVLWIISNSYGMLVAFALVMGSSYGGMVALSPAVMAELFGVQGLGAMLGALYSSSAISALVGPPLAGFVVDYTGSYLWAAGFAGAAGVVGFLILIPLKAHAGVRPSLAPLD